MAHHTSTDPLTILGPMSDDQRQSLRDKLLNSTAQQQIQETIGPTGTFPAGKLVPHDEGGLIFGVTVFNGRVIFDFGKPVRSIGFTREAALELAEIIRQRAMQCPELIFPRRTTPESEAPA